MRRRPSWGSRAALGASALVLLGAALASLPLASGPASAAAKPTITLGVGQTITQSYPAIQGQDAPAYEIALRNGNADAVYPYPEHCTSGVNACDSIPVKLNVTPVDLVTHQYVLSATVNWDPGPHVDNLSGPTSGAADSAQGDNLASWIWPIPHGKGPTSNEDGYAAHAGWGTPPPEGLSAIELKTTNFAVVVENFSGVNKGYTVTLNLVDASVGPGADLSIDKGFVDNSVIPTGAITQSAPVGQALPIASPPAAAASPAQGINAIDTPAAGVPLADAPLTGDPQLDALVPHDDAAVLGAAPPKRIGTIRRGPGPAHPVAGSVALLWLVALPLAAGLAVLGLLLRKRRSEGGFAV